ncbi:hypothetical protein OUZ56_012050 [Daphnia magna]|uniref:Uncharacterized protein n=1 Tax=Daphnia magna TaxID=35525 RepID=A0ABQ9Z388_9CRUS|nr:hypothetical protein OUZ56_012050 [Daphnia magna]
MIVKQHPCLADNNCEDNYLTVKHKVVRAVGNQIDSKKHGRIRNLKRNQQKASAKRNSGGLNQYDAANSTSGNLSTAVDDDFPDHESKEELRRKHDFDARREFFKINHKLSLAKLLEKTPHYHDFEKAYDDFLMMYPTQQQLPTYCFLLKRCQGLLHGFGYLNSAHTYTRFPTKKTCFM